MNKAGEPVLPAQRRREIATAVAAQPSVRTDELAEQFGVSGETIRRDLLLLQREGLLERVHGGATPAGNPRRGEDYYRNQAPRSSEAKNQIAALAQTLITPGMTISVDLGSTSLALARALPMAWSGTVLTPSLLVALELANRPGIEVVVAGGRIRPGDYAASGTHAQSLFREFYADLAFVRTGGIHPTAQLTDFHSVEVDLRRIMIQHAARNFMLADSSKFGIIALQQVCQFTQLTGLISDTAPVGDLAESLAAAGVLVLTPEVETSLEPEHNWRAVSG